MSENYTRGNIPELVGLSRRQFLTRSALAAGSLGFSGIFLDACSTSTSKPAAGNNAMSALTYQIAWVGDNGVLGEVVAAEKGYYKDAGLDVTFKPGGASVDPLRLIAANASNFGQINSSPSLMVARSQGLPLKAFGVTVQKHPYAFFSLPKRPVRTPQDLVGKTVGIQATGQVLLSALLAKNNIDPSKVKVQIVGNDAAVLAAGKVDVFTGWLSNPQQLSPLGSDYVSMSLWDAGIHLYADLYFATDDTIKNRSKDLQSFLVASAKGWEYARQNVDEAINLLLKKYSSLQRDAQLSGAKILLERIFTSATAQGGFGTMDADTWQQQIDLWTALHQFKGATPTVDDVMTMDILNATASSRPKAG